MIPTQYQVFGGFQPKYMTITFKFHPPDVCLEMEIPMHGHKCVFFAITNTVWGIGNQAQVEKKT